MTKTKEGSKINIHTGHRDRLLEQVDKIGLENMTGIQQLEYMLTLAIPRKDVNPVAHALLSKFGSLHSVLEADSKTLENTGIVTKRAARILSSLPHINICHKKSKMGVRPKFNNSRVLYDYCSDFLKNKAKEELYIFCLDGQDYLLAAECVLRGTNTSIKFDLKDVNEAIVRHNARSVFLAHSHTSSNANPSNNDIQATKAICKLLEMLGIPLKDHIIIANENVFSFFQSQLLQKIKDEIKTKNISDILISAPKEGEFVYYDIE